MHKENLCQALILPASITVSYSGVRKSTPRSQSLILAVKKIPILSKQFSPCRFQQFWDPPSSSLKPQGFRDPQGHAQRKARAKVLLEYCTCCNCRAPWDLSCNIQNSDLQRPDPFQEVRKGRKGKEQGGQKGWTGKHCVCSAIAKKFWSPAILLGFYPKK